MNKLKFASFFLACISIFNIYAQNLNGKGGASKSMNFEQMSGDMLDKIMSDKKEKEKYFVIDVREANEYNRSHVRYAVNISVNELEKRINEINDLKDKNIVTICQTGNRSSRAAKILKKHGFSNVFNAAGMTQFRYSAISKTPNIRGKELAIIVKKGSHFIIDARMENDYKEGHLKGAVNITPEDLEKKLNTIPKDKPIAVYCYSGNRAFQVAESLVNAGYNAKSTLDGTTEYKFNLVR